MTFITRLKAAARVLFGKTASINSTPITVDQMLAGTINVWPIDTGIDSNKAQAILLEKVKAGQFSYSHPKPDAKCVVFHILVEKSLASSDN